MEFFDDDDVDLYDVLGVPPTCGAADIKKAYRQLALRWHPDKNSGDAAASRKFQQIGYAYAVLADAERRKRYDATGSTEEGLEPGEGGWDAYFAAMFERVTNARLDEMKSGYQGSQEELDDLKRAYVDSHGDIAGILSRIPHCTVIDDEQRFVDIINGWVESGEVDKLKGWERSVADDKARRKRRRKADKEAKEADKAAKELGGREQDSLQALILKKKANADSFLDGLAAKYASKPKKGKRKRDDDPLDDAEFERIQSSLKRSK